MHILFTTSEKSLARLIRWATGEDCSHCAIQWDEVVIHSNWKGVNAELLADFRKQNQIIHSVEVPDSLDNITKLLTKYDPSLYDIGALLFLGLVLFCRKALNLRTWPKRNLWQSSGMFLCTEFVTEVLENKSDSLITPHKLYEKLAAKRS